MCDANGFAIGAVLGQKKDKVLYAIYYVSRTLTNTQLNYTTTKKYWYHGHSLQKTTLLLIITTGMSLSYSSIALTRLFENMFLMMRFIASSNIITPLLTKDISEE
ncbi:amino acid permease 5-like [Gossypium australe]|uniref:Amino acid permease 5-like n=1 Tax=Gossypium australe TaxID=47621 RepID=A0A5B6X1V4_9ROSI|nr:amino acid permease 5-like [Gossypium australe]